MRSMNITRTAKNLKNGGLLSRMGTGHWSIDQKDQNMAHVVISISNHDFCSKREKYTKEIREELDPRDKEYTFPFQTTFDITQYILQTRIIPSQNAAKQQENTKDIVEKKCDEYIRLRRNIFNYVSEVSQNTTSIAFRLLSKKELTDGEAKAFAVKVILANIQSVLINTQQQLQLHCDREVSSFQGRDIDNLMEKLTKAIDEELSLVFSQLAGHYPQAPNAGASASMREVITDLNRVQDQENNLIFSSKIKIDKYVLLSKDGKVIKSTPDDYIGFVMEVINQAIGITRTKVVQDLTLAQKFQEFNEKLFAFTSTAKKMENLMIEGKRQLGSLKMAQKVDIFSKVLEFRKDKEKQATQKNINENKAALQSQQRVVEQYKKDHKVLVAQKIPNHVKQFSHADLKQRNFKVNNSSVLRIMTKWVESLQNIFLKADQEIGGMKYQFKDIHNNLITYQMDQRAVQNSKWRIVRNLKDQYEEVKKQLNKLNQQNTLLQSYILSEKDQSFSCLKRFSKVREASAQINAIAIEYTKKYLCILIHHLIKAGHMQFSSSLTITVNLVVFRVGDLLRSKLQCSERDFINVMNVLQQLDNSKQMEQKFKLVRIKNKLATRDNNVLINYMFMGKVQCELQLSVQKMESRDKHYYNFCHFLYQLTRGKLGVITECAIVVCQHDSVISSSRDAYYRPKCYDILQRKKKMHKIHQKDKEIYKCINCGQLKIGENTQLFQKESSCNMCIIKQDGAQRKMKDKIGFLLDKERIRNYQEINDGDYVILAKNQKADAVLKIYKAWRPREQMKLFLVQITEQVLKEFQNPGFQYDKINYFNILKKQLQRQDLKELTYKLGKATAVEALQYIGIDAMLLQKIDLFFQYNQSYRTQKNLIKQVKLSGFINAGDNPQKWRILKKIVQAYSSGDLGQLRYKRYKKLDWMHIKGIDLRQDHIESVRQLFQLTHGCKRIEIGSNRMTQVYLDKLEKLQYLNIWQNRITSIDLSKNPLLTELHIGANPLTEITLSCHPNLRALYAISDSLQHVDVKSCINLNNLQLGYNNLQEIDLSNCINLETISLPGNKLQKISIGCNKKLKVLSLEENSLKKIDVSQCVNLEKIWLNYNQLENLNLQGNPMLKYINFSRNPNLQSVKFWYLENIPQIIPTLNGLHSSCRLTVLYRKEDAQKYLKWQAQLKEIYSEYIIQSEERN